ncbi:translocase of chloroplast 159, chloroplastic [Tanacetum coccineum]
MAFIQLGWVSRVDEMILARERSGFAGEKYLKGIAVSLNESPNLSIVNTLKASPATETTPSAHRSDAAGTKMLLILVRHENSSAFKTQKVAEKTSASLGRILMSNLVIRNEDRLRCRYLQWHGNSANLLLRSSRQNGNYKLQVHTMTIMISFSLDAVKHKAAELEADRSDDLDFGLNILAIGKAGVGKIKEISGIVGGVPIRVFDTPGFKSSIMEQGYNRSVLASTKKFTKKNPLDIVLYVDRLDAQTRDHNGFPLLKTITTSLGPAIWKSVIVTLTHGASAPPEGSNGLTLSYEMFVIQRSHIVQQAISQAVGDMRMMSPSLMNPVSLSRPHPKLSNDQDGTDSDAYLADLTDSDNEEDDDEYDQLSPFKPLKISQVSILRKELKKAYFNEYVYRYHAEAVKRLEGNDGAEAKYKMLPGGPSNGTTTKPE